MAWASTTLLQNRLLDLYGALFSDGWLEIRDGTRPAVEASASGTALMTLKLAIAPFAPAADGAAVLAGDWWDTPESGGTASWFRLYSSDRLAWVDGDISDTAGSGQLKLSSTTVVAGEVIRINDFTITPGAL